MPESVRQENLQFTEVNREYDGTLGILRGPVADFLHATRNGRKYSESLWNKVFNSEIVKEMFENGGIPGELDHPVDRSEICSEKIAILMPEPPKKNRDGELTGMFKILDTPCGRILYALAKAGFNIGVSSRATGDTYEDENGDECVDEDTYDFQCFDAVILPAVKKARMRLVTESLDTSKVSLRKSLNEAFERSSDDEKELMKQTLQNLEIDYKDDAEPVPTEDEIAAEVTPVETIESIVVKAIEDSGKNVSSEDLVASEDFKNTLYSVIVSLLDPEKDFNNIEGAEGTSEEPLAAENSGADVIQELQDALVKQQDLESQVQKLQEKLSVCYTKEARYSDFLTRSRSELAESTKVNERLTAEINSLKTKLEESKTSESESAKRIELLEKKLSRESQSSARLHEDISKTDAQVKKLSTDVRTLEESLKTQKAEFESENSKLQEALAEGKKDLQIARSQASAKLEKSQQLVEKYKTVAKVAVDRYISSQCKRLGINPAEVKSRLSENYSFKDIDTVCESLQKYKLTVNSLPFSVDQKGPVKMRVTESKERIRAVEDDDSQLDDSFDSSWFNL